MKIFLGDAVSYLGKALAAKLKAGEHEVVSGEANDEALQGCGAIILDLNAQHDLANQVLQWLKTQELESSVVLLGISTVMTWNKTNKVKAERFPCVGVSLCVPVSRRYCLKLFVLIKCRLSPVVC
jgi:hypothetical protein